MLLFLAHRDMVYYKSFQRWSSQPISWLQQNTQPSQPITWLIQTPRVCQSGNRMSKSDALRLAALLVSGSAMVTWHFAAGSVNEMAAMCRQRKRGPISIALLTSDRSPIVVIFAIKGRQQQFLPLFVPKWHAYCLETWTTPSLKI